MASSNDLSRVPTLQKMGKRWKRQKSRRRDEFTDRHEFHEEVKLLKRSLKEFHPKMKRLQELDLFVLDNSLRETTVLQLRGHTTSDKHEIYREVKKCGFEHCIVESFHHMTRVGDQFVKELRSKGEDMSNMYAFVELVGEIIDKVPQYDVPVGFSKSQEFGIKNVIIELDLVYFAIDYNAFNAQAMCNLLMERFKWVQENLGKGARTCINFRDFSEAMKHYPRRVLKIVHFISSLKPPLRPFALLYEDLGKYLPEELGAWTKAVREQMERCGWDDGHLLVHVHQQWGMSDSTQLECLAQGADGIWAGLCEEGAAMGHASSCVTIMNLIRMGNTKVVDKFNCQKLVEAAQNVTKITTDKEPHVRQHVYGARALDIVFGFDPVDKNEFNFAEFLGIKPEIRITSLAKPELFTQKLKDCFGENKQFTLECGKKMKEMILESLINERKEEYNSKVGLAMLFNQSGGELTNEMNDIIDKDNHAIEQRIALIQEIKYIWDKWDLSDGKKDDHLTFDAFYNAFMAPYFGCYRCEDSRKGLQALDMDHDGMIDWKEFKLYLTWAGRQYPDIKTMDELLDIAFRKGLIPAMQSILLNDQEGGLPPLSSGDEDSFSDGDEDDDQRVGRETSFPLSNVNLVLAASFVGVSVVSSILLWIDNARMK